MRVGKRGTLFHQDAPRSNPWRLMFWAVLIVIGLVTLRNVQTGDIQPLFQPTPTPTRSVASYREEGAAFFEAGNLDQAISAYQDALAVAPDDYLGWMELARIQTYSAASLTQERKRERLQEALASIDRALELAPEESAVRAVRAFVLDWSAGAAGSSEERAALIADASREAILAIQFDSRNTLALAYQAEVFADQQQYTQAFQYAQQALSADPTSMDARRVYAFVLEANGDYAGAIEEYKAAAEIAPNLTFLYISIGQNYRQLSLYDQALEYFDRAARINEVLGIEDPLPYVAIAKTYTRMGEFYAASLNAEQAIRFDPTNPDLYGQLGHIRFQARNFEGAMEVLECAVEGCTAERSPFLACSTAEDATEEERADCGLSVEGLPLTDNSVVYYYVYTSATSGLNFCEVALPIMNQVSTQYADDPLVMSIIDDNYAVCANLAEDDNN